MPMAHDGDLFWLATNLFTGIAYVALALCLLTWRKWLVPVEYRTLFAAFIFFCGTHHLAHALVVLGAPYFIQVVCDSVMTVISVITAVIVLADERG